MTTECPKAVAQAIMKVQKKVKMLTHDAQNDFQSYPYVSIDAYYENVRPWLNDAGLMIVPFEEEASISPDGRTYKVRFAFVLMVESGEMWDCPIKRTVYIPYGGAQSCGSALSYADKFLMRTLFKIPTGEYDPEEDNAVKEIEQLSKTVVNDADATSKPKKGQDDVLDYEYAGPPYRMFGKDMSLIQSFSDIKPWGMMLKARIKKDKTLYEPNKLEIERCVRDVNDDTSISAKAKTNLLNSLETLVPPKAKDEEKEVVADA